MGIRRRRCIGLAGWAGWLGAGGALGSVSACAPPVAQRALEQQRQEPGQRGASEADLLFVNDKAGLSVFDANAGRMLFDVPRGLAPLPAPDWSKLFATAPAPSGTSKAGTTRLATLDARTGKEQSSVALAGGWAAAVAAGGGRLVALTPRREGETDAHASHQAQQPHNPYMPPGRERTTILVAEPAGRSEPQRFELEGNFEPEAFTTDGRGLVLLEYLPPLKPDRYRVRLLSPQRGREGQTQLQALLTRDKRPNLEEMRGTGRLQVYGPGCRTLYTLYTRQLDHVARVDVVELGGPGHPNADVHAFVHVLSLAEGWAFCLDLPLPFGLGPANAHTLAVSRDGHTLYAADSSSGVVIAANTTKLQVSRKADLGLRAVPEWADASAQPGPEGRLYLAAGPEVIALGPSRFEAEQRWPIDGVARGIAVSRDGRRVYVGAGERVLVFDAHTGNQAGAFAVPGLDAVQHLVERAA
ncbi:MAG: hypothetical protein HY332_25540 [Chloroflexi bacterium]|nr:hypothetical protein [Chloroflexota bacterium]